MDLGPCWAIRPTEFFPYDSGSGNRGWEVTGLGLQVGNKASSARRVGSQRDLSRSSGGFGLQAVVPFFRALIEQRIQVESQTNNCQDEENGQKTH